MIAMAPVDLAHAYLVTSLLRGLGNQLRDEDCAPVSNLRVFVPATGLYTYPDMVVFCGKPQLQDAHLDTLLNPTLLVEVLSPSTEAYDRGRKFEHYRSIESVKEYLLVASDRMHADLYTRQADDRWILTSAGHPQDNVTLNSIGCELKLAGLYRRTEFAPKT